MKYYIILGLLIIAILYRIIRHSVFFEKDVFSIKIISASKKIKIDRSLLMFIIFSVIFFSSIKVFDNIILLVLILLGLTFFRIEKIDYN